jgi:DNA adenine methylase
MTTSDVALSAVTRPPLRYFGSKYRLAPWIIRHMPRHVCYCEPFGGGAGVLLRKPASLYEVYNDLDGEVVNFFRMLRERTADLVQAIQLTPHSREEQRLSFEPCDDPFERARRLYVRSWQSYGGCRTQWHSGWRYSVRRSAHKAVTRSWGETDHLWPIVARLKQVQIEHDDALKVIARFDDPETLYYCDPPYLPEVRSRRWRYKAYAHECDEAYHRSLAELLREIEGMVLLSGYDAPLYRELYAGWEVATRRAHTDFASQTTECLWISPRTARALADERLI